jgi:hypothetical protein
MVDPDDIVKNNLVTLSTYITNATTIDALNEIEIAVNAAEAFFKDPDYADGLAIVEKLKGEITAKENALGGAVDTVAPQATEMTRVTTELETLSGKDFAAQNAILKTLVTSVATNAAANPTWDYASVQAPFLVALKAFHGLRVKTSDSSLKSLQNWYKTLVNTTTKAPKAKLLAAGTDVISMINEITNDRVINSTNLALKQKTLAKRVAALKNIAKAYKTAAGITTETQKAFAAAIMQVGGTWIYKNYKNIDKHYAKRKTKSKADKTKIKNFVKTAKKNIDNFGNYKNMLAAAYASKLLSGTKTTGDKSFVYKVLSPYTNKLIALGKVK